MSRVGISRHEIEFLFRNAKFSIEQIEKISEIVKILGKYMFVDRYILEKRSKKGIGLSYIKKAQINDIITVLKGNNTFYYQLGMGGIYLLEKANYPFFLPSIVAGRYEKSRILTFNYFAIENGYDISMQFPQDPEGRYFFCNNDKVLYFSSSIDENSLVNLFISKFSTPKKKLSEEDIRANFDFVSINRKMCFISPEMKSATLDSIS